MILKIRNQFVKDVNTIKIAPTGKITLPNGKTTYSTISDPSPELFSMDFKSNKCNRTLMSHLYGLFREPFIGIDKEKAQTLLTWFDELASKDKLGEYNSLNKDTIVSKRNKSTEDELKDFTQKLIDYLSEKTGNTRLVNLKENEEKDIDSDKVLEYEFVQITNPEMSVINGKGMGNCIFGNSPSSRPRSYNFASQVADAKGWLQAPMNYTIVDYNEDGRTTPYVCKVLKDPYPFFIVRDKNNSTFEQDHRRYVLVYADKDHWCIWNDEDSKIIECHIGQNDYKNANSPKDENGKVKPSIHVSSTNLIVAERCLMRMVTGANELKDKTGIDIQTLYDEYKAKRASGQILLEKMTDYAADFGLHGAISELTPGGQRNVEQIQQNERDRELEMLNACRLSRYTTTINYFIVDSFNNPEDSALSLRINLDINYLMKKYLNRQFPTLLPNDNIDPNDIPDNLNITPEELEVFRRVRNGDIEGLTDEQMDEAENVERIIRDANSKIIVKPNQLYTFEVFLKTIKDFKYNFQRYTDNYYFALNTLGFPHLHSSDLSPLDGEQPADIGIATMFKPRNLLNIVKLNNIPQQELDSCNIGQQENAQPFTSKDDLEKIIESISGNGDLMEFIKKSSAFSQLISSILPPDFSKDDTDLANLYKKSVYNSDDVKKLINYTCSKSFELNTHLKVAKDVLGEEYGKKQLEDFKILNILLEQFTELDMIKMLKSANNANKEIKFPKITGKNQIDYATCNRLRNGKSKEDKLNNSFGMRFTNDIMDLILNKYSKDAKSFNMIMKLVNNKIDESDLKEGSSFYEFFNNPDLIKDINALHVANVSDERTIKNMSSPFSPYKIYKLNDDERNKIINGVPDADDINAQNEDIKEENDNENVVLEQNNDEEIKKIREREAKDFQELLSKYENHPLSQLDPTDLSIADVLWVNNYIAQKSIVAKLQNVFGENGTATDVVNKVKELLALENGAEELKKWFIDEVNLSKSQAGALTNSFTKDVPNEPTEAQRTEEEVNEEEQEVQNEEVEEPEIIEEDDEDDGDTYTLDELENKFVDIVANENTIIRDYDIKQGPTREYIKIKLYTSESVLNEYMNTHSTVLYMFTNGIVCLGNNDVVNEDTRDVIVDFTEFNGDALDRMLRVIEREALNQNTNEQPTNNNVDYTSIIKNIVNEEANEVKNYWKDQLLTFGNEEQINELFNKISELLGNVVSTNGEVYDDMRHFNAEYDDILSDGIVSEILSQFQSSPLIETFGQNKIYDMIEAVYEGVSYKINENEELPDSIDGIMRR